MEAQPNTKKCAPVEYMLEAKQMGQRVETNAMAKFVSQIKGVEN